MNVNRPKKRPSALSSKIKATISIIFIGVGLGTITGSIFNSFSKYKSETQSINRLAKYIYSKIQSKQINFNRKNTYQSNTSLESLHYGKEITKLSARWQEISNKYKDLTASGYFISLENGNFAKLNHEMPLPAASSIKIPILVSILKKVDAKEVLWNEKIELNKEDIAGGSGWMGYQPIGKKFPLYEVANEMIRVSDNTATNLIIKRLGGLNSLNSDFEKLNIKQTKLINLLPDLNGENTTSTKDLVTTIANVDLGNTLNMKTRDLFREVMSTSLSNRLIPTGLLKGLRINPEDPDEKLLINGFRVYNKTGDIGIAYADAALIEMPNNTRAVAAFIVKGPFNDPRSTNLIREMAASLLMVLEY